MHMLSPSFFGEQSDVVLIWQMHTLLFVVMCIGSFCMSVKKMHVFVADVLHLLAQRWPALIMGLGMLLSSGASFLVVTFLSLLTRQPVGIFAPQLALLVLFTMIIGGPLRQGVALVYYHTQVHDRRDLVRMTLFGQVIVSFILVAACALLFF